MRPRILCTTAIEESWPADGPILFLGEWCRRHSRRLAWSKRDHEVLPYHWDDRARLLADYREMLALHERLLADLSAFLNQVHRVDHSPRYWRILAGRWLGTFVQIAFDRWTQLQLALQRGDVGGSRVARGPPPVPNDMVDFLRLHMADEWNHHLCAIMLREYTDLAIEEVDLPAVQIRPVAKVAASTRAKLAALRLGSWGAGLLTRPEHGLFINTYLSPPDELRLNWRFNGVLQLRTAVSPPRLPPEIQRRSRVLPGTPRDDFDAMVRELIPRQLPSVYLEGYSRLVATARSLRWPSRPSVIWTSNQHTSDDVFNAWTAEKVEQGAPLVIGQHGGHYGTGLWCFAEDHDREIADAYFTWGWSEDRRTVPLGQFLPVDERAGRSKERTELLLATVSLPRLSYWMYSSAVAGQWLGYFDDQCRFAAALPDALRAVLRVRLYPADFGWDQAERWRHKLPDVRIDDGGTSLRERVNSARIFVATYNATTFLETIAADVPTIIFWNEAHWELRDSARSAFEELRKAGVFHGTPESAAAQVARVWDDVDAWWQSETVRHALRAFRELYCARPHDLLERVTRALRAVAR
jgi:putative transferase (TIGR04331 family)